jgi:hypothetical protein
MLGDDFVAAQALLAASGRGGGNIRAGGHRYGSESGAPSHRSPAATRCLGLIGRERERCGPSKVTYRTPVPRLTTPLTKLACRGVGEPSGDLPRVPQLAMAVAPEDAGGLAASELGVPSTFLRAHVILRDALVL